MNRFLILSFIAVCGLFSSCQSRSQQQVINSEPQPQTFTATDLVQTDWQTIERRARGTTVNLAMYAGDEARNRFFQTDVRRNLKEKYDINLNILPLGDTAEAISKLLNERKAGKTADGSIDAIWINGENFRTVKSAGLLWGKFADKLPNFQLYDRAASQTDFGTQIENLEAPWQKAQFVFAYDSDRVNNSPRSIGELKEWIRANPGKFSYPAPPDFTGSAFLRHVLFHFGGGAKNFANDFDEQLYQTASKQTFEFLNEIKPFLWRAGENYPNSPRELDRLFADGEVDFTFNYSPNFAAEKIRRGEFAPTVKTFVLSEGTISGYSFLSVPFNAANPAGALVAIDYLMSPENMIAQARELGSLYPHDLSKLTAEQLAAVQNLPVAAATLSAAELAAHAVPEADAQYLERLEKDWREQVLLK